MLLAAFAHCWRRLRMAQCTRIFHLLFGRLSSGLQGHFSPPHISRWWIFAGARTSYLPGRGEFAKWRSRVLPEAMMLGSNDAGITVKVLFWKPTRCSMAPLVNLDTFTLTGAPLSNVDPSTGDSPTILGEESSNLWPLEKHFQSCQNFKEAFSCVARLWKAAG